MENKKGQCFIITPIGENGTETRMKADGVIEAVIRPVLEELKFDVISPKELSNPGSITDTIFNYITNCELVIANMTGLNPNVMYELAIRHAVGKPVVCIIEKNEKLPFDIQGDRLIPYTDNMFGVNKLKEELIKHINEAINDPKINNPFFRALNHNVDISELIAKSQRSNEDKGDLKLMLDRILNIESILSTNRRRNSWERPIEYKTSIDILLGKSKQTIIVNFMEDSSVQDVLNKIYFKIEQYVEPYKYMQTWILREKGSGAYMIMYEITNLIPAKFIFSSPLSWEIVSYDGSYNPAESKFCGGMNI